MSEREYYTNLPYVNYCKMKGYDERKEEEAAMMRIASYRIHQSLVQKPMPLHEYWPLPSDKKQGPVTQKYMTKEMLEKIKKVHKIKIKDV